MTEESRPSLLPWGVFQVRRGGRVSEQSEVGYQCRREIVRDDDGCGLLLENSVVGQWPGSLTQARVMTDLGHDPIIFLGHDPILKNGSWPRSWPVYLKISALMAISWDPHSNLRKLIFKIEMMLKKEIDRRMTKSVDIWRNMNFYSIFFW